MGFRATKCSKIFTPKSCLCRVYCVARTPALQRLQLLDGRPFRAQDAGRLGVPHYELRRLVQSGDLTELSRGVYQRVEAAPSATIDLATVSARVPMGSICLNSALAYWDLTDEIPSEVHVAVPRGAHRPQISYPPTRVHVFAADTFALGRMQHAGDEGAQLWIFSPARTVVDSMRLPRIVGRDQALAALRRYLETPGAQPRELVELARRLRAAQPVARALEVLLS
jgi:predicted transcriptional regulator of viral defense system